MKKKRKLLVAILACLLAVMLLLPMVLMVVSYLSVDAASSSSIQSEIDKLKKKNKDLDSQRKDLNAQLKAIRADKNEALSKKEVLESQIEVIQETIQNLDEQIDQYGLLIEEKKDEVAQAKVDEADHYDRFLRQVRVMEEEGAASYWSILFAADSFSDLLDRVSLVNDIGDYNQQVCDDLEAAREALEQAQSELETAQGEAEEARTEQQSARDELKEQEAEVEAIIKQIKNDEALAQKALSDLDDAAKAMDAEIVQKEKELEAAIAEERRKAAAGQGTNKYQFDPGSGYYWPLPAANVTVTSFFGPRSDPFTGKRANHTGTDISAPKNTPIYAAHGGVVLTSEKHSSYGNYVVVSRGDGITTLYAHMTSRAVKAGDVVSQGQVIGYVGSTGRSTGNHLHYEIRVNGVRQDALAYYPNINWINHTGFEYK